MLKPSKIHHTYPRPADASSAGNNSPPALLRGEAVGCQWLESKKRARRAVLAALLVTGTNYQYVQSRGL